MISKRKVEKLLENAGRGVERFVCRQLKKLPRITTNPTSEFPPRLRTEIYQRSLQHGSRELTSGQPQRSLATMSKQTWFIYVYYSVIRSEISQTEKRQQRSSSTFEASGVLEVRQRKQAGHRGWAGIWDEELVSTGSHL